MHIPTWKHRPHKCFSTLAQTNGLWLRLGCQIRFHCQQDQPVIPERIIPNCFIPKSLLCTKKITDPIILCIPPLLYSTFFRPIPNVQSNTMLHSLTGQCLVFFITKHLTDCKLPPTFTYYSFKQNSKITLFFNCSTEVKCLCGF